MLRRARPLLGTLVDIGVSPHAPQALEAAFDAVAQVQRLMSVFEPDSDLARSHAAAPGEAVCVHAWTAEVLGLARELNARSGGLFDVALGSGAWRLQTTGPGPAPSQQLVRLEAGTRLNLGGLAKGWAVDQAVQAALAQGAEAVWVNAGGDLRVQGMALPLVLRDEAMGGTRPWAELRDGAAATSDFGPEARARLSGPCRAAHVSVIAPRCAWADALTKVVALCGGPQAGLAPGLLRHYRAQAWVHDLAPSLP